MSSPPPRKRVRQRASVANKTESSEMFDEAPPTAATPTQTAQPGGSGPSRSVSAVLLNLGLIYPFWVI